MGNSNFSLFHIGAQGCIQPESSRTNTGRKVSVGLCVGAESLKHWPEKLAKEIETLKASKFWNSIDSNWASWWVAGLERRWARTLWWTLGFGSGFNSMFPCCLLIPTAAPCKGLCHWDTLHPLCSVASLWTLPALRSRLFLPKASKSSFLWLQCNENLPFRCPSSGSWS